jgi:hypothetical protein
MTPSKTMRLGPFRTAVVHLECVLRSSQLSKKGGRCTQCGVMTYSSIRKVLFSFNYSLKKSVYVSGAVPVFLLLRILRWSGIYKELDTN